MTPHPAPLRHQQSIVDSRHAQRAPCAFRRGSEGGRLEAAAALADALAEALMQGCGPLFRAALLGLILPCRDPGWGLYGAFIFPADD